LGARLHREEQDSNQKKQADGNSPHAPPPTPKI
jgi:hypothetical protein